MSRPFLSIENRRVGEDYVPLVIAEIGINHQGSIHTALQMVDAACAAGAEVIKHQTHIVEDEMSKAAQDVIPGNADISIYDIMASCALSYEDEVKLMKYVQSKGMIFLSTPFSRAAADRLEEMGVSAYKIGSGEMNNFPLIEHIANFGKPMIVSTGMNAISSIEKAVSILERKNISYALLHTTNLYPTPPELVRLGAVTELRETFPNAVIGLSDHTLDNNACLAATALGASILERHFTDSKERPGPDIICSMTPDELTALKHGSEQIAKMRGGSKNNLLEEEQVTRDFAYATVVTIRSIKKGDVFSMENIWVKRPGTGEIPAEDFPSILGKKATRDLENDAQVNWSDIEQ